MNKVCEESDFIVKRIMPAKIFSTEVLTSIINQETGVRGYIISKDRKFLKSYYLGNVQIAEYYTSLKKLKNTSLGIDTTNELNTQMKTIQLFFKAQIALVNAGKIHEAEANLSKGQDLVDKFRIVDNQLINTIDLDVNISRNKVATAQRNHKYLAIGLGIVLTIGNLLFIKYIWDYMYIEVEKKNVINKELQKLIISHEEFIANISHELKTPLNVIFSAVQLIQLYCNSNSLDENKNTIYKYLNSMRLNSYRLSKLINNIVDSSKINAGSFTVNLSNNDIVIVVENIVESVIDLTDSKGINIVFDTDVETKFIACDPEIIDRIVLNLLSNAIKFSDKGEEIFIDVKDKGAIIEISVKDSGIGIEQKDLEIIFERFKQVDKSLSRNTEGSGIGLSLVKSIVKLHGGNIRVESEFGKGSKFIVTIPSHLIQKENMIYDSKVKCTNENALVELSDIY